MMDSERYALLRKMIRTGDAARIRKAAHVPQAAIGRDVGVSAPCVSKWESGKRTPTGPAALRYLRVLERLRRLVNDESGEAA